MRSINNFNVEFDIDNDCMIDDLSEHLGIGSDRMLYYVFYFTILQTNSRIYKFINVSFK